MCVVVVILYQCLRYVFTVCVQCTTTHILNGFQQSRKCIEPIHIEMFDYCENCFPISKRNLSRVTNINTHTHTHTVYALVCTAHQSLWSLLDKLNCCMKSTVLQHDWLALLTMNRAGQILGYFRHILQLSIVFTFGQSYFYHHDTIWFMLDRTLHPPHLCTLHPLHFTNWVLGKWQVEIENEMKSNCSISGR